ncbi:MAG: type II toxin-antitoxin system PemK/MazF family toxin [Acidobacteria bacterium]|nr:type II toxin-antitoxin system PemK/MazF family toxin [Acidobacteriota bacterium]
MIQPGAVVTVDFPGATGVKRRPALVVSTPTYHATRPDVVLAVVTSQTVSATAPSDYVLQDWQAAGLHKPSAFRAFLVTLPAAAVGSVIGQLSGRDWHEVQARLRVALAV